ncbi:MAG: hypothetical protein Q9183_001480 [Haloplaca sp. 2 TL-2023]
MSGMAGNKGAVAIRMDYANTRICLVTAHLAAGFANYEERNRDYRTISHGLRFQRNRSIDDHDTIIWLGDFNYRIGLGDEKVRRLIQAHDLGTLYQNDQVEARGVMKQAQTDERCREKARIPAWCDRILRKGNNLKQIDYTTAALRFSDHRPVYATFQCTVSSIDEQRKEALSCSLYKQRKSAIAGSPASSKKTDEDIVGYKSVAEGLPPASSGRRKWWLDNGMHIETPTVDEVDLLIPTVGLPVRSQVQPPQSKVVLNPARPLNPFSPTREPDWVMMAKAKETELPERNSSTPPVPPSRRGDRRLAPLQLEHLGNPRTPLSLAPAHASVIPATPASPPSSAIEPNMQRKPAPPIPKKPTVLSSRSTGPGDCGRNMLGEVFGQENASTDDTKPALAPRRQTDLGRTSGCMSQPYARGAMLVTNGQRATAAEPSPHLFSSTDGDRSDQSNDNLLDVAIEEGGTIPSLKPSRPG